MVRRLLVAVTTLVLLATAARADVLEWTIQSEHPNIVSLEFYSQDYNHAWPGGGQVWIIDDYADHTYTLECTTGELICYGAWVRGDSSQYWGVGIDDSQYCSDCCAVCGGGPTQPITLLP